MSTNRKRTRHQRRPPVQDDEEITSDSEQDALQDAQPAADEDDQEPQQKESAEQKRLRLAKAYIKSLQVEKPALDDDASDGGEDEFAAEPLDGHPGHDRLAETLKVNALSQRGQYQRAIAQQLRCPDPAQSHRLIARPLRGKGRGGCFHRTSLTAVALHQADAAKAYSVSKDGALVGWDLTKMCRIKEFTYKVRDQMYNRVSHYTANAASADSIPSASASASASASNAGSSQANGILQHSKGQRMKNGMRMKKSVPLCVAVSSDGQYVVVGGTDAHIAVWDARTGELVKRLQGHKGAITGLTFQKGTNQLFSTSMDRTIKIWSLDDMAYIDTLFGHVAEVNAIDCLRKERLVSVGSDRSCRIWKVPDETQLLFKGHSANADCCAFVNQSTFVSGSQDGTIGLWSMFKKKAVHLVENAHPPSSILNQSEGWISSICAHPNSDLVASGAGDGFIRIWSVDEEGKLPKLQEKFQIPVKGYVNGLEISQDARLLVGAVGQEPRLGRWNRNKSAKNALFVQRLVY